MVPFPLPLSLPLWVVKVLSTLCRRNLETEVKLCQRMHQMFSVRTTPEKIYKRDNHLSFWISFLRKTRAAKSRDYNSNAAVSKCFTFARKRKAGKFKFLWLEKRFRKRFSLPDGLAWTVGLTAEITLRF